MGDLARDAKHEDWMEKMEDVTRQLDIINQNLSSLSLVLTVISQKIESLVEAKKAKRN